MLKTEFIYQYQFNSLDELQIILFDYVYWYNHERIHGAINYMTPIDCRQQYEELADANIVYALSLKNCTKKG